MPGHRDVSALNASSSQIDVENNVAYAWPSPRVESGSGTQIISVERSGSTAAKREERKKAGRNSSVALMYQEHLQPPNLGGQIRRTA
jgi:hypothetical protein